VKLDLLILNANIVTIDDNRPQASAIGTYGDRIVFVGNDEDAKRHDARQVINAAGKTIVPGFNDAHQHMSHFGDSLRRIDLSSPPIQSIQDILDAVASRAAELNSGDWIIGSGYDQNKLHEKRHPLAKELDRAAPNNPVMLQHTSGHMMSVNTALIKLARINDCVVPPGGKVVLDHVSQPTGLILEQAQDLISTLYKPHSIAEVTESLRLASNRYLSEGITSCQEAGVGLGLVGHTPVELSAFQNALENNDLEVRVNAMIAQESLHYVEHHASDSADKTLDLGLRTGFGNDWLRISNTKVFADGSLIGRTCAMFEPFANDEDPQNNGFFQMDVSELKDVVIKSHRAGWQVGVHAIGDRAVSTVLDIYEEALAIHPRIDHRHRIEHAGVVRVEDVTRMARLGVIPVPQARFISELGDGMIDALGSDRVANCYRQKSFLDAGIPLPGSSDRPVVKGAPLLGLHDLVNQKTSSGAPFNPHEALTIEEALTAYTIGSAYAAFDENRKGSLSQGKLADLVVLDHDLRETASDSIADITVRATMVGGQFRYDPSGFSES
jgi:predicted amidohydrolase YtcJ|tara:strand:+ start:7469 stop:9127 length:1659 start_codon:yes stop_codon:yes gene_type:complete